MAVKAELRTGSVAVQVFRNYGEGSGHPAHRLRQDRLGVIIAPTGHVDLRRWQGRTYASKNASSRALWRSESCRMPYVSIQA